MIPPSESILAEAQRIVDGPKREEYGDLNESIEMIAGMWSNIFGARITMHQVALCMVSLKLARESYHHKRDNLVDLAAYAHIAQELYGKEPTDARPDPPDAQ